MKTPTPLKMLDLCSGLGGASEAFLQAGHDVQRIENNPILSNVANTTIMDISTLKLLLLQNEPGQIDLIWASPPCREFSNGYASPKSKAIRAGNIDTYQPDMSILQDCIDIIEICKPKYWVIENVVGATRYFNPILGQPRQIIGAYVLWGNFPLMHIDKSTLQHKKSKDVHSSNPLRANLKAKIPIELSQALLDSITTQKTLF